MPIKGLTEKANLDHSQRKMVRLGTLGKGYREGFGKNIKLHDTDHFVFKPAKGQDAEALTGTFAYCYGDEPTEINDVRIPVEMAGNFDIESCAWMTASMHTSKGSVPLGRSDGEWVYMMRDPGNGRKVHKYKAGEVPHDGRGVFYMDKWYPWQASFAIDLVLQRFNYEVANRGIGGQGVVTLFVTSLNDITTLVNQYRGIVHDLASLTSNPMIEGDYERAMRYLPLQDFPLRLFRSVRTISTPHYEDVKKGIDSPRRILVEKSLLQWQLSPEFELARQNALKKKTQNLLTAVENIPLLTAKRGTVDDINALLITGETVTTAEPVIANSPSNDHSSFDSVFELPYEDIDEGEFAPSEQPINYDDDGGLGEVDEDFWERSLYQAKTAEDFSMAFYMLNRPVFDDAAECKRGLAYICGDYFPENVDACVDAMKKYAQVVGDGGNKSDAAKAAQEVYNTQSVPF